MRIRTFTVYGKSKLVYGNEPVEVPGGGLILYAVI